MRAVVVLAALLAARQACALEPEEPFRLFEEEARVVTASRRPELAREAPSAVEVVTAEDIRASGAVNLWDVLRFRTGMHVVEGRSFEGNRALVSVRGFPKEFVDSLLVLIDGRSVYTSLSGGVVWESLPVQMHDIERIEIVRGPSSALYGSNAALGVINIITRRPEPGREAAVDALAGTGGLWRQQAFFEDGGRAGAYRVSYAHKTRDGHPAVSGVRANDFLFSNKGNFRGSWRLSPKSELEAFSGGVWDDYGLVHRGDPQGRQRHHFEMLRWSYAPEPGSSVEAMAARRDDVRTLDPSFGGQLTVRERQYDAELTHRVEWLDGAMHTVYGGSLRYTDIESSEIFPDGRPKNAVQRGFASQSWAPRASLRLIAAASVERSDTGGVEPALQAALIASPLEGQTFRLSYGLAPTIPPLYHMAARHRPSANLLMVGNPQVRPQRLRSHEAGYRGVFLERRLTLEADLFYMEIDGLRRNFVQSFTLAPQPLMTVSIDNGNHAAARGAEARARFRWGAGRWVYANYAYETVSDHKGYVDVLRGTPRHRLNLGGSAALGGGLSASLSAGFQDAHTLSSTLLTGLTRDIGSYWRLDARLAWRLPRLPDAEVYAAAQDLLVPRHVEFADGLLVPRTWLGGLSLRFR